MKVLLFRICFLLIMLGGFSGSVYEVRANDSFHGTGKNELRFEAADNDFARIITKRSRNNSLASFTRTEGHRVACSRSVKLIPTHEGKPGSSLGIWSSGNSYQHSKFNVQLLNRQNSGQRVTGASPRLYYVIALRRLLC